MAVSNEQESSLLMVWDPVRLLHVHRDIWNSPNSSDKGKQEYKNYHIESNKKVLLSCSNIIWFIKKGEENLPSRLIWYCYDDTQALIWT